jgi:hypothetical protein
MKKVLVLVMVVAVVAALAVPLTVSAATTTPSTGPLVISATVPVVLEVDAPSGAVLGASDGTMSLGPNTVYGGDITVTVKCTKAGWTLGAKDASGSAKPGYMYPSSGPALASALQVEGGIQTTYTNLSGTDVMLTPASAPVGTTNINNVNFQQTIGYGDTAGAYTISVTFTGTAN